MPWEVKHWHRLSWVQLGDISSKPFLPGASIAQASRPLDIPSLEGSRERERSRKGQRSPFEAFG